MASSIWGGLASLGDAAVDIGSTMLKSHLSQKLEQQREARADERAKAKELRDSQKETGTKLVRDSEGATWLQGVNSAGRDVGAPTLASAQDIKKYNQEEATNQTKMSLDALTLLGKEREAADYVEDKSLERAAKQAQIDQMKDASARGWAGLDIQRQTANARAAGTGRGSAGSAGTGSKSMYDYIDNLAKTDKALLESYGEAIDPADVDGLLQNAVTQAARYGLDTRSALRELLYEKYGTPGASLADSVKTLNRTK